MVNHTENRQEQRGPHQSNTRHQAAHVQYRPTLVLQQSVGDVAADYAENRVDYVRNGRQTDTMCTAA